MGEGHKGERLVGVVGDTRILMGMLGIVWGVARGRWEKPLSLKVWQLQPLQNARSCQDPDAAVPTARIHSDSETTLFVQSSTVFKLIVPSSYVLRTMNRNCFGERDAQ